MDDSLPSVSIPKPDDWHCHLRDGAVLKAVLPYTAQYFARAVVMPNLNPPVVTAADARAYRERIRQALPPHMTFTPLMTAYLTDATDPDDLTRGFEEEVFFAAKLYPAGTTTNSENGVTDLQAISPLLEKMQRIGMPLLIHGESLAPEIDIFDREAAFIDHILIPLRRSFPQLKIVLEHITTVKAAQYVVAEGQNGLLGATITPHHLLINRNAMFEGGFRPHNFCLPVPKSEPDRQALIQAATSGAPMFFAGTDSAPHSRRDKESACGKGGIFSAPQALAIYATVFEQAGALDRLADFVSLNGPAFYNLDVNAATITLEKSAAPLLTLNPILMEDETEIVPFPQDRRLSWYVVDKTSL